MVQLTAGRGPAGAATHRWARSPSAAVPGATGSHSVLGDEREATGDPVAEVPDGGGGEFGPSARPRLQRRLAHATIAAERPVIATGVAGQRLPGSWGCSATLVQKSM